MSLSSLSNLKKLFGSSPSDDESRALYKETLLMVLSRASRADMVTDDSEIEKVQQVMCEHLGEDVPAAEIRVAASSELFERSAIDRTVSKVSQQLDVSYRKSIASALTEVIRADGAVTASELEFFNKVVNSLALTPAQLMGLEADQ